VKPPRCILFVVPGPRRLPTLRRAYIDFEHERAVRAGRHSLHSLDGRWPLIAATVSRLRAEGHLAAVWERIDETSGLSMALTDLPARGDLNPVGLDRTVGRRWRKVNPDFWRRLSPLGVGWLGATAKPGQITPRPADPKGEPFAERLRRLRKADLAEARRDAEAFRSVNPDRDLRFSTINGSMDDREDDVEEEPWR
jgi:hypothetical protein